MAVLEALLCASCNPKPPFDFSDPGALLNSWPKVCLCVCVCVSAFACVLLVYALGDLITHHPELAVVDKTSEFVTERKQCEGSRRGQVTRRIGKGHRFTYGPAKLSTKV